jgi:hypothetical protein
MLVVIIVAVHNAPHAQVYVVQVVLIYVTQAAVEHVADVLNNAQVVVEIRVVINA